MYIWSPIIKMLILATVLDYSTAGCPAECSCSTVDGYVNSRTVQCSFLRLSDIPSMLNSSTVHTLDLSNNEISILKNASFSSYSRLSTLILSYNKVEMIEINAFAGLVMLREIDLSSNKLKELNPEIFSSNPVLDKVDMSRNKLVYLPSDFPILISDSISYLDLSVCDLTAVHPVTFSRLPSLYELNLSSNNLQTISLGTLENLPDLRILNLNNNRWTCNCDIVEVMQWAESKKEQLPAHKPVKCWEGQQYRILWTMAGGNRSCGEYKTTEPVVARLREFTTDMAVDLPTMSEVVGPQTEASPRTTLQRVIENAVTIETELPPAPEGETGSWQLSWNVKTLTVFIILPITLGVAVFVSLTAVNYIAKRGEDHRTQPVIRKKYNHVAAFFSKVPFLKTLLTANITKQHAKNENRSSYGVGGTENHVYALVDYSRTQCA